MRRKTELGFRDDFAETGGPGRISDSAIVRGSDKRNDIARSWSLRIDRVGCRVQAQLGLNVTHNS